MFRCPTVARFAALLASGADVRIGGLPLVAGDRPERLPLSGVQRGVWFVDQLEGPSATYNVPLVIRLCGVLDAGALRQALTDVVVRHEALRTSYPVHDGEPWQHIADPDEVTVPFTVAAVTEDELPVRLAAEAGYLLDLASGLPLRAVLLQVSAQEHVLVLVVHHIAFDGWSITPLMRDLGTAYTARAGGGAPGWAPLPVQYADYTLWQDQVLAADEERQLGFWREQLAGLPAEVSFPADRPRPAVASYRGASCTVRCAAGTHQALTGLARENGSTLFMVVQAATAAVLARSGAGTDIAVGSPVAGRADEALEDLAGFFVNTLVLRTDVSGNPTFRDLLDRVRDTDMAAWDHQDLPFDRLVEVLNPDRSAARHPLFQVMLALADADDDAPALPGLTARTTQLNPGTAKFDIDVNFLEHRDPAYHPHGLDIVLEYAATDLYDPATIKSIARRLARVLDTAATDPGTTLSALEVLDPAERRLLLHDYNHTTTPLPQGTIHQLFTTQATHTPDAVAVVCGDVRVTYRDLDTASSVLAGELAARGVRTGACVGVFLDRSVEYVVAVLGVLKAGAAYVPLDAREPGERQAFMLADTGAVLLVTDTGRDVGFAGGVPVLRLGEDAAADPAPLPKVDPVVADPDQLAYVMYTSGSTGQPKGVANTHRNVVELALDPWWEASGQHRRVLAYSPLAFDSSTYELWVPLLSGGTAVVLPAPRLDVGELAGAIGKYQVTAMYFTTALFDVMASEAVESLAGLAEIWTGGDVLSAAALRRVLEACPQTTVVHAYGPTETTVFCSYQVFGAR